MNKNLITFENKLIKVLLKNVYKKIDVEITYQFVNPYQLITKELKILKNSKNEISSSDLRNLNLHAAVGVPIIAKVPSQSISAGSSTSSTSASMWRPKDPASSRITN